jgi:DNA modification methylase
VEVYRRVLHRQPELLPQEMVCGDCRKILTGYPEGHFDFIATDPPYNIHFKRTMANGRYPQHRNRHTDYDMHSDNPDDFANLPSYRDYLQRMEELFRECYRVLKRGRYLALIVRNAYQNGEYIFTHVDLARRAKAAGFVPKGEIVWYQNGTRLRPYGYPYSYVPNIAHQFIVVLRKE